MSEPVSAEPAAATPLADQAGIGAPAAPAPRAGSLNARLRGVLGAALIVMSGFVASKLLGFIRNVVISYQYGASREYESFIAAISLPDMLFQILAGGAVGAAFIPVFTGYFAEGSPSRAWRLTSALITWAIVGIGAIAIIFGIAAPLVMKVLVPGWSPEDQAYAAHLARIMIASPVIFAVSALVTSVLNGLKRFALAALAPLMYNLSLICGALLLRSQGAEGLAVAAVVGALLHLLVQVPGLMKVGMRYTPTFGLDLAGTHEVGKLMVPRMIGLGVNQVNQLINVTLASFLVAGSIAYLNYAWLILMVPLGVFGMGISTAVFPTLAEQVERRKLSRGTASDAERDEEASTFLFVLRLILYLTVPAAVVLIVLGRPLVGLVLERGAFDAVAATATAVAVMWYALGLPGHSVIEIVDRVFYAERDTATPVKVAAGAVALNLALCLILMRTPLSFGGLALANSVAALTEASTLTIILHRRTGWVRPRVFFGFGWRIGLAALGMAIVAMLIQGVLTLTIDASGTPGRAAILTVAAILGGLTYVGICELLGIGDARRVAQILRGRG